MTGTVEFIQRIRYVEVPDEKGEMNVYAIPETVENVRELVRCKDCKQSGRDSASYPHYWCSAHSEYHDGDWFCADGERREGR